MGQINQPVIMSRTRARSVRDRVRESVRVREGGRERERESERGREGERERAKDESVMKIRREGGRKSMCEREKREREREHSHASEGQIEIHTER